LRSDHGTDRLTAFTDAVALAWFLLDQRIESTKKT
jgi:hypothetical protein